MDGSFWLEINLLSWYAGILIFFFNLTAKYKCSVVYGCYVRERNSTYIHTFQHKNIQPFTREKRLGGVHSHKHFSKPRGTFWKESTVPTSLLLEWAEIAQQMGDSGWFLAAQSDNSTEFGFTGFCQHCPALQLNPFHGHIHLWEWPAEWQRK